MHIQPDQVQAARGFGELAVLVVREQVFVQRRGRALALDPQEAIAAGHEGVIFHLVGRHLDQLVDRENVGEHLVVAGGSGIAGNERGPVVGKRHVIGPLHGGGRNDGGTALRKGVRGQEQQQAEQGGQAYKRRLGFHAYPLSPVRSIGPFT